MAILEADLSVDTKYLKQLAGLIPELNGGFLGFVGSRARTLLKEKYLSGQEINLKNAERDRLGRYLITSDVNRKRDEVKIYSYPVNLFETGRTLRDGSKEAGKFIITEKLKQSVMMNMASYTIEYDSKIQKDIDNIL